jgi:hypothetical protein
MFGADNAFLSTDQMGARLPDYKVYVPADSKDTMYSFVAGAITFWDRRMKGG